MFVPMNNLLNNDRIRQEFQEALLQWFEVNKRTLPWRERKDWYGVFLSEFLLQQTQVTQALPYFQKLIRTYPTVEALASASEDELLRHWAGLGYYSRARNLRKAAKVIVERFSGRFPQNYAEALSLPGIGPYTASAILSIAFNQPLPVVDGNVIRVITRVFNIGEDVRQTKTQKQIREIAAQLLPNQTPGRFNEAMMELGALTCQPTSPLCEQCPLQKWCLADRQGSVLKIPFKSPPAPKKHFYQFVLLFVATDGRLLTVKRPRNGLLASMWEFPTLETTPEELNTPEPIREFLSRYQTAAPIVLPQMKHIYSHISLRYRPLLLSVNLPFEFHSRFYVQQKWLQLESISSLALHNAHKKILTNNKFAEWWQRKGFENKK